MTYRLLMSATRGEARAYKQIDINRTCQHKVVCLVLQKIKDRTGSQKRDTLMVDGKTMGVMLLQRATIRMQ